MGSALGKSTLLPTRIGSTWGVNVLSFCSIRATDPAPAAGISETFTGSSHTTTPEKSMCLRTAASSESRNSTRPDTDPAAIFSAASRTRNKLEYRLEKIRECQVIVWIDPGSRSQVSGAYLRRFKAGQDVRAQAIHDVCAVALILRDPARTEIAVPVVLLPAVNVKRSSARGT